jgi:glycosyltransferase involved in cell wall biosynthesis
MLHNFYRGVLPSGEDLNVLEHPDLVGATVAVDLVRTGNNYVVEHPIRGRARAVSAALGLGSETRRYVEEVVARRPDVVHIENLTPMIPESVVGDLLDRGLPVVRRWGNFRFRCPSGDNFRAGRRCQDCSGAFGTLPAILHGCYGTGRGSSAVVAFRHGMISPDLTQLRHLPISNFLANELQGSGVAAESITVIPNSVPASVLDHADRLLGAGGRVLFLGALLEKKGIRTLLSAWALLAGTRQDLSLRFIGDGPLRPLVESAAESDPRITFIATVPYARARVEIHDADVVVVPSEWDEPFGRVVIEAFAEGTPVVVSDRAALPELLGDSCGRTFAPGNAEDLAEQIGAVLFADASDRAHMSEAARERHHSSFSQIAVRGQWLAMYAEAAQSAQ